MTSRSDDVKLIGSFHYGKKNYHLVKLLEPIFIVGVRRTHLQGYFYELLNRANATEDMLIEEVEGMVCKDIERHDRPAQYESHSQHNFIDRKMIDTSHNPRNSNIAKLRESTEFKPLSANFKKMRKKY